MHSTARGTLILPFLEALFLEGCFGWTPCWAVWGGAFGEAACGASLG